MKEFQFGILIIYLLMIAVCLFVDFSLALSWTAFFFMGWVVGRKPEDFTFWREDQGIRRQGDDR